MSLPSDGVGEMHWKINNIKCDGFRVVVVVVVSVWFFLMCYKQWNKSILCVLHVAFPLLFTSWTKLSLETNYTWKLEIKSNKTSKCQWWSLEFCHEIYLHFRRRQTRKWKSFCLVALNTHSKYSVHFSCPLERMTNNRIKLKGNKKKKQLPNIAIISKCL